MHTLLELYVSTKREVVGLLNTARMDVGSRFSLVTNFWTSKTQSKKYVGVRLYMVDVMGTLFEELCGPLSDSSTTQLLGYLLGLTRVVERILDKWEVLREANAVRKGKPIPVFPLAGHREDITQLLSILNPITANNALAQLESPAQVDVLLGMYRTYINVVNPDAPLRDHRSLAPPARPEALTSLVSVTRNLLSEAFYSRFIKRYTCVNPEERVQYSYVFEMQLLVHPDFKSLGWSMKPVVLLCIKHHRPDDDDHITVYAELVDTMKANVLHLMVGFATPAAVPNPQYGQDLPMDENLAMFGNRRADDPAPVLLMDAAQQAEVELTLWLKDTTCLVRTDNIPESVTTYWGRQPRLKRYKLLPLVARSIFSVPASSAQLKRDFGVSGMQITPQRVSTAAHSVDMCPFVNRNREFLNPTQCMPIAEEDRIDHLPSNILVNLAPYDENEIDFQNPAPVVVFSNTLLSDEEEFKEEHSDDEA